MVKKLGKHDKGIVKLVNRLCNKPYVKGIDHHVEYDRGELDVCTYQGYHYVYYEYKCNHTLKGYTKAKKQCQRWTKYFHRQYPHINFYGVYVTKQTSPMIISKNGRRRS